MLHAISFITKFKIHERIILLQRVHAIYFGFNIMSCNLSAVLFFALRAMSIDLLHVLQFSPVKTYETMPGLSPL